MSTYYFDLFMVNMTQQSSEGLNESYPPTDMSTVCSSSDCLAIWCKEGSGMPLGNEEAHEGGDRKQPLLSRDWAAPCWDEMMFCKEKIA